MTSCSSLSTIVLKCSQVSKKYDKKIVLQDFNLLIHSEEVICLLGPSGCGKTTLLKIAGSFITPDSGLVEYKGLSVNKPDPGRVMVFQEHNQLFPWKTVIQNVIFGLKHSDVGKQFSKEEQYNAARQGLLEVGLEKAINLYPHELSGGMKQRAALARALISRPNLLLMDEPFASVDSMVKKELHSLLSSLISIHKTTVFFVTHDIQEALALGSRILIMNSKGNVIFDQKNTELNKEIIYSVIESDK